MAPWLLVPMDERQADHLKAYGLAFRALERGERGDWLLNWRGGSFLVPASSAAARDATLAGITVENVDDGRVAEIKAEIQGTNADAVPLEKAPKVAVYAPPNAAPWDDAVTMALNYAGIKFEKIWDAEVIGAEAQGLRLAAPAPRGLHRTVLEVLPQLLRRALARRDGATATSGWRGSSGYPQRAGAQAGGGPVDRGVRRERRLPLRHVHRHRDAGPGARERRHVDIAASYADGTPMDPQAAGEDELGAGAGVPGRPAGAEPDGRGVLRHRRTPGEFRSAAASRSGSYTLFNFSAKIDPVATMLVQNHREVIPDFYGLTTSFTRKTLKPGITILAEEAGRALGQVHPRRPGQGHLDVLRRSRSRGSAAPDRRRADRPVAAPAFAGVSADPEQRAVPRREEEGAEDLKRQPSAECQAQSARRAG